MLKSKKIRNSWQHDQVFKSAMFGIDKVAVPNLLAPLCCVFEKDTLGHCFLLGRLGKKF